jgi:hypothetical protein
MRKEGRKETNFEFQLLLAFRLIASLVRCGRIYNLRKKERKIESERRGGMLLFVAV